jgi:hypothetical protein
MACTRDAINFDTFIIGLFDISSLVPSEVPSLDPSAAPSVDPNASPSSVPSLDLSLVFHQVHF